MFNQHSLRYRINLTIALTLTVVTLVFGLILVVYEVKRRSHGVSQIESALIDLTDQYRVQLGNEIFAAQTLAIGATLTEIMGRHDVLSVTTYDETGQGLVAKTNKGITDETPDPLSLPLAKPVSILEKWNGQSVLAFTSPIEAYGETVGFWRIRYSLAEMNHQTLEIVSIFTLLILTLSALIFVLLNSLLVRFVLQPVCRLKDTMEIIQAADDGTQSGFDQEAKEFKRLDQMVRAADTLSSDLFPGPAQENEIASLAHSFRHMLSALNSAYIGSRTDILTQLSNRLKVDEALVEELKRAQRYKTTFSLVLLDIDRFKKINDTHGHLVGDQVLKQIAELLKTFARETDTPSRWGGEEFLVLLPRQNSVQAGAAAERLRQAVSETQFSGAGKVTASFGVAEYSPGETIEDLIKRVDDALYRAKEEGRDRVVVADS